jgi:hypothetical protein
MPRDVTICHPVGRGWTSPIYLSLNTRVGLGWKEEKPSLVLMNAARIDHFVILSLYPQLQLARSPSIAYAAVH